MAEIKKPTDPMCEVCRAEPPQFLLTFLDDAIATDAPGVEAPSTVACCLDCRNDFERRGRVFRSEFYTPPNENLEVTSEPTEEPAEDPPAADA